MKNKMLIIAAVAVTLALAQLSKPGSGGGGTALTGGTDYSKPSDTGAYASIPTCNAAATGQHYYANEGFYDSYRCSGSTWQPILDGRVATPPQAADFTAITQGSGATYDNTVGPLRMLLPNDNTTMLVAKTAPATPYYIKATFRLDGRPNMGMGWRESSAGKCIYFRAYYLAYTNWEWASSPANGNNCTPSTISSNYTFTANYGDQFWKGRFHMIIRDDGTTRYTYGGTPDNLILFESRARATDLGAPPDQVQIFVQKGTETGVALYVLDWKVE